MALYNYLLQCTSIKDIHARTQVTRYKLHVMLLCCTTDQQTAKAHKDMLQKQGRGRQPASKHERKQCCNDNILKICIANVFRKEK